MSVLVTPSVSLTDGTFEVPSEVPPRKYRTAGPTSGSIWCYWYRLKGLSGDSDDIITTDLVKGPTTLVISDTDKAFKISNCQPWVRVG